MKEILEMGHEEITSLSDKQLERMVDIRCAEGGIPILSEPIAPVKPEVEPDMVAYQVHGIATKDRELAGKISIILADNVSAFYSVERDYKLSDDCRYLKPVKEGYRSEAFGAIEKLELFSRDRLNEHSGALADYKKKKDQYDKDRREFEE